MKMRIQLNIENESGVTTTAQIAALERREYDDLIGISLEEAKSITTWKRHVARVGGRLDEEAHHRLSSKLALNKFGLPTRNPLRAVGIDGGYVKASDAPSRQEGWFEVMVGKSLPRAGSGELFAFHERS
jgi:trimethylamine:corrinoid methyltransferase-like protein